MGPGRCREEAVSGLCELLTKLLVGRPHDGRARVDDEIEFTVANEGAVPVCFSDEPLGPVADHRASDFRGDSNSQPWPGRVGLQGVDHQTSRTDFSSQPVEPEELAPLANPALAAKSSRAESHSLDRQAPPPLTAAAREHFTAVPARHAGAEAVGLLAVAIIGLIGPLHG